MKIAIIGTGHVGGALGGRWARDGHEIIFGSRDPQGEKAQNLLRLVPGNVRVAGTTEAVSTAEVVLLATPWSAMSVAAAGTLAGRAVGVAGRAVGSVVAAGADEQATRTRARQISTACKRGKRFIFHHPS